MHVATHPEPVDPDRLLPTWSAIAWLRGIALIPMVLLVVVSIASTIRGRQLACFGMFGEVRAEVDFDGRRSRAQARVPIAPRREHLGKSDTHSQCRKQTVRSLQRACKRPGWAADQWATPAFPAWPWRKCIRPGTRCWRSVERVLGLATIILTFSTSFVLRSLPHLLLFLPPTISVSISISNTSLVPESPLSELSSRPVSQERVKQTCCS